MQMKPFYKQKTFYAGVAIFICAGLNGLGYNVPTELILGLLGLEGLFIRHGMKK